MMSAKEQERSIATLDLDKVIHERSRLVILAHLASSERAEAGFTELKDSLGFSAGNLSAQLRILEEAGYIGISKRFVDKKPFTGASITVEGQKALAAYLGELENLVAALKGNAHSSAAHDEEIGPRPAAKAASGGEEEGDGSSES
ncbi:MAG: transcriptional regulator [Spirochaetaceae bacterium]|nr:transcriptional regulator [Spirochaetaceae bacterium]